MTERTPSTEAGKFLGGFIRNLGVAYGFVVNGEEADRAILAIEAEARADALREVGERTERVLREYGVDSPDNQGLHGWRCQYPDRYPPCSHFEELLAALAQPPDPAVNEERKKDT